MTLTIQLKKSYIQWAILALLGLVFFYLLFDWGMGAVIHSRKTVLVPDLNGKTLTDAVTALSALNLGIKKEGETFDQNVPAGIVVRQNPLAGMAVRESKIVRVTISQGGRMVTVPTVIGQPMRSAEIAIRSAGFSLGEKAVRYSIIFPKDYVVSQDPAGASPVDKDDAMVNLVISQGPPPNGVCLAPSFTGKTVPEATQWAQQYGLQVTVRDDPGHLGPPGVIYRQDPVPDADCAGLKELIVYASAAILSPPATAGGKIFYYEVPQGGENRSLRIVLRDEAGEIEIFSGVKEPGTKLSLPVNPRGNAKVRVLMDNILVEKQEIK